MKKFISMLIITFVFSHAHSQGSLAVNNPSCNTIYITFLFHDNNYSTICADMESQLYIIGPYSSLSIPNDAYFNPSYVHSTSTGGATPAATHFWDGCNFEISDGTHKTIGSLSCGSLTWDDPSYYDCLSFDFGITRTVVSGNTLYTFGYF